MKFSKYQAFALSLTAVLVASASMAADVVEESTTDLAKAAQNPIASLISLPFQNNTNFDWGPNGETENTLNVQPVWPFDLAGDWKLITRTIVPVKSVPTLTGRETGLGDTTFTGFFSPTSGSGITWGVGPVVSLPTATDDALTACDCWGLGPSVVVLAMPGKWVLGSLFSQVWDVGGKGTELSFFTWQPFINYNLQKGWYLSSAPIITANWEAESGEEWTVPVGGGVGKIVKFGKQPANLSVQTFYNVAKPTYVGDWSLRLQLQLLFPK